MSDTDDIGFPRTSLETDLGEILNQRDARKAQQSATTPRVEDIQTSALDDESSSVTTRPEPPGWALYHHH